MSIQTDTARDLLLAAFEDMVVRIDEETLEASDERTGVRYINWIMADLAVKGIDLGFTKISNISDEITIPEGAMMSLTSLLAFRLWPKYRSKAITTKAELLSNAKTATDTLVHIAVEIASTEFPSILPRGSGNDYNDRHSSAFYPELQNTILSETGGSIAIEDDTYGSSGEDIPEDPTYWNTPMEQRWYSEMSSLWTTTMNTEIP